MSTPKMARSLIFSISMSLLSLASSCDCNGAPAAAINATMPSYVNNQHVWTGPYSWSTYTGTASLAAFSQAFYMDVTVS